MTSFLDRWAGWAALASILVAGSLAAARAPYGYAVLAAAAGLGLLFASIALAARRTRRLLEALSSAWRAPVEERTVEEGAAAWFALHGFPDYAGQVVRRLRTRTVASGAGALTVLEARLGPGKSAPFHATVLSAPAATAGAVCLYPEDPRARRRARWLGGTVRTGGPLDARHVVFGEDAAAAAAASSLDAGAIESLFQGLRDLGVRRPPGLGVTRDRASVLAEGVPPAALLAPDAAAGVLEALRRCVR
jgi:hypothetical protein